MIIRLLNHMTTQSVSFLCSSYYSYLRFSRLFTFSHASENLTFFVFYLRLDKNETPSHDDQFEGIARFCASKIGPQSIR